AADKVKKSEGEMSIPLTRTADILGTIGPAKTHQFLCGFSMETRDMVAHSAEKLRKKNLDMIVANNLKDPGAGFGVDTNLVTFLTPDGGVRQLPLMSKEAVAGAILDEILARRGRDVAGRFSSILQEMQAISGFFSKMGPTCLFWTAKNI